MTDYRSRRTVLKLTGGVGSLALLAGCLGGDDDPDDDSDDEPADDGNGDDEPADDGNGDDEPDPDPAYFDVSDLDPEELTIDEGETIDVSATVANTGEQEGEQDVELRVDDETLEVQSVDLEGDESETVSFEGVATEEFGPGGYTFGVYSEDGEATGALTIYDPDGADFQVSDLDPEEATIEPGDPLDVSATVTNVSEQEDEQDIDLRVDGETLESESLELDPDESETVSFEGVDTDSLEGGEYTFGVYSNTDSATGTLTVDDGVPEGAIEPGTTIDLDGQTAGWVGIAPEEIEDEENPTLTLVAGEEYELGWSTGDGGFHNIAVWDDDGAVVDDLQTDETNEPGEDQWLEFEASQEMASYVCEPHAGSMVGDIEVVE